MRIDRILAAAFVVLVSTAIIGFSTGSTGASFTSSTTNPNQSWKTENVAAPASQNVPTSAIAGAVNLSWPATTTPANGHTITYLVFRNGTQIGATAVLTYSDTPPADGTNSYTIQTKISQGAGFFTSGSSPAQNGTSDRTAPTMSITCNGAACGGWTNAVTVSGVDGGTGMGSVTYSIDGGGNVVTAGSTNTFTPADGTHTVAYFGTDVAGNVQSTASQTVKIETVAPTAVGALASVTGVNGPPVTVDLTWTAATDATSGVAGYTVHWVQASVCPGASVANYPSSAAIGVVTSYSITGLTNNLNYCAYLTTTDNAGNVSVASAVTGPTKAK